MFRRDSLSLEFSPSSGSSESGQSGSSYTGDATAEVVTGDYDFSSTASVAGNNLSELHGRYIASSGISESSLTSYASQVDTATENAVVLQMKAEDGKLVWASQNSLATGYSASGTLDLKSTLASLKAKGIYLVAEIACCNDTIMATRNTPLALKDSSGSAFSNSSGYWLDPYNSTVRQYISDLASELADMGFDEILLSYFCLPVSDSTFVFTDAETASATSISNSLAVFARNLRTTLSAKNVKLSTLCSSSSLRGNLGAKTGQDLTIFSKFFDRLYCYSSSDYYETDLATFRALFSDSTNSRFVPLMSTAPASGSQISTSTASASTTPSSDNQQ